jgi:putative hemolysin
LGIAGQIGIILLLTLLNGLFSAAEIALLSVRKTRLAELAEHHRSARAALALRNDPERLLATVQVGITVLGATAGAFGGVSLAEPLGRLLASFGAGDWAEEAALLLVVAMVSFLGIVMGELVPKSLALKANEAVALTLAPVVALVSTLARPLVWFLTFVSNQFLRPFGDATTFSESRMSPEELQQMVEAAATSGSLNQEAGDIASRAIDLAELRVSHVMVPRTRITALPLAASRAQLIETLRTQQHSRYPVYRESLEDVSGYVLARDAYASLLQGEVNLEAIKREVQFLPATVPAVHALRQLQAARAPLAMVVDETGGLAGLVTVEDVTEELVGDIVAEHERPVTLVQREGPSVATVSGSAPIHEVNRELGLDLDESGGYATIAGLVLDRAQSIPGPGTAVELGPNVLAEVLDVSANQVRRIRLSFNAVDVEKE